MLGIHPANKTPVNVLARELVNVPERESVLLSVQGDPLVGTLYLPGSGSPCPALVMCHGAGEFKENYEAFCEFLSARGVAALALDMHGHGASGGDRYYVQMQQWVADILAAVNYLSSHPQITSGAIGAFGMSSGGTAVLEAALVEPRLKAIIALDPTVRNFLPLPVAMLMRFLICVGRIKKQFTGRDLRLGLAKMPGAIRLASDPKVDQQLKSNARLLDAYMSVPLPGAADSFFVNTLQAVSKITIPTMVIWGAEDQLDPPETAHVLFDELKCKKEIHIIAGNGHVGHMDRNKEEVFALTAGWALENLTA